jgi:hypothetical protein
MNEKSRYSFEMKKRYIYAFLLGVPGFLVSLIISSVVTAAAAGFLWIYVFGDSPWPASAGKMLPLLFIVSFMVLWSAFIAVGFITGKKIGEDQDLDTKHIMVSAGTAIVLIAVIVLYEMRVGNIGPKSDTRLCAEFCGEKGYQGSSMSPKDSGELLCTCFGHDGQQIMKVPMDGIGSVRKE